MDSAAPSPVLVERCGLNQTKMPAAPQHKSEHDGQPALLFLGRVFGRGTHLHIRHGADVCKPGAGTHIQTTQRAMEGSGLESGDWRNAAGSRLVREETAARRQSFSESAHMKKLREGPRILAAAPAELRSAVPTCDAEKMLLSESYSGCGCADGGLAGGKGGSKVVRSKRRDVVIGSVIGRVVGNVIGKVIGDGESGLPSYGG